MSVNRQDHGAFIDEADDFAAMGEVLDKFMADPEAGVLMSTGTASPIANYQSTFWVDVPRAGWPAAR